MRDRLNLRTKGKSCRICSPADRNSDVAEPRESHHNIVLWPQCGTSPGAPHRPPVFAQWAQLPHGPLTSSSAPIRSHRPPSYRGPALVRESAAWGQSTSRTLSPLPDIQENRTGSPRTESPSLMTCMLSGSEVVEEGGVLSEGSYTKGLCDENCERRSVRNIKNMETD